MKHSPNHITLCSFQLLQKDPTHRLGSRGVHEIKKHTFFKHMDWEALLERRVEPPYIPPKVSLRYCPIIFMEAPYYLTWHNKHIVAKFHAKQKTLLCLR